ncbi:hypothetical protein SISNIDRAFT_455341 [Sistotremastrum niveocremeum HHB9708]|uniref:Uncharacterized protein n=1 Tax=Sistotremastrum niveocremeum HHB9708 TaxID=1314777 RepID=A0A164TXY8_9AGAM|nr:hypothetical protein SISNIDRAFT_455341 [Sistotremastrum niveocremeum HHB9708]
MTDVVGATALVVSFVAFLVAILQVVQQYAATAYDYRRCSQHTIGSWARHTHRRWIWSEVRFEIMFATPRISLSPRASPYTLPFPSLEEHVPSRASRIALRRGHSDASANKADSKDAVAEKEPSLPRAPKPSYKQRQYAYVGQTKSGKKTREWYDVDSKPWFLQSTGTAPEAKCSWLSLLQSTTFSDTSFTITSRQSSFDYMPDGVARPLASMEQRNFLTLMTLYRINWRNRGVDADFSGASDIAEVTTREITNFGRTYRFTLRDRESDDTVVDGDSEDEEVDFDSSPANIFESGIKYYITSERARSAMFNRFELGFATILTHTSEEVLNSLKAAGVDHDAGNFVKDLYDANGGWGPGLAEGVQSWAYASMPKCVDERNDSFKSIYSAISIIACFGEPPIVAMLCNEVDQGLSTPQSHISSWARTYLSSRPAFRELTIPHFKWVCEKFRVNIFHYVVPWSRARSALAGIVALDEELETDLLKKLSDDQRLAFKLEMLNAQVKYQCRVFPEASAAAAAEGKQWWEKLDPIAAQNGQKIVQDIKGHFGGSEECARNVLMNRWMRGALWAIHNSNCCRDGFRELECSLASKWLEDTSTVYIA